MAEPPPLRKPFLRPLSDAGFGGGADLAAVGAAAAAAVAEGSRLRAECCFSWFWRLALAQPLVA